MEEKNIYLERKQREDIKRKIAQELVSVIKGQNVNVDIALNSLEYAKNLILIMTNV